MSLDDDYGSPYDLSHLLKWREKRNLEEQRKRVERQRRSEMRYYVLSLDGRTPVLEADPTRWQVWIAHSQQRVLRQDVIEGAYVSTVFLGVAVEAGKPMWQMLVLAEGHSEEPRHYFSYDEALKAHEEIVALLRGGRAIRLR